MDLDSIIYQVRALVPVLGGRVGGAFEYAKGAIDQGWLAAPAAYVLPLDDEPSDTRDLSDYYQMFSERVAVIIILENKEAIDAGDRRGQAASRLFDTIKWQLFKALVNWNPNSTTDNPDLSIGAPGTDHASRGIYYAGGEPLDLTLARSFYRFTFALDVTVAHDDVWQPGAVPLKEVGIDIDDPYRFGEVFGGNFEHWYAHAEIELTSP